jgi:deoxyadenosine/deoxycytidine kinase
MFRGYQRYQMQYIKERHAIQLAKGTEQKYKQWSTKYQISNHTPIKIDQYELLTKLGDNSGLAQGLAVPVTLVIIIWQWNHVGH